MLLHGLARTPSIADLLSEPSVGVALRFDCGSKRVHGGDCAIFIQNEPAIGSWPYVGIPFLSSAGRFRPLGQVLTRNLKKGLRLVGVYFVVKLLCFRASSDHPARSEGRTPTPDESWRLVHTSFSKSVHDLIKQAACSVVGVHTVQIFFCPFLPYGLFYFRFHCYAELFSPFVVINHKSQQRRSKDDIGI